MISTNNYNKTNFGMSVKAATPGVVKTLERELSKKGAQEFNQIVEAQKNNPVNVIIKLNQDNGYLLSAHVNGKRFNENPFSLRSRSGDIIAMMKKAAKHADEQASKKELLKGLDVIG